MEFAFQPAGAQGATPTASTTLAVTTSVAQLTLPVWPQAKSLRLVNNGAAAIAWSYGVSANLSMTNGVVMLPNTVETFSIPPGTTQLSVIGAAASSFSASVGEGA